MEQVKEKDVIEQLKKVIDPEIGCSIVDLGLIYKIDIDKQSLMLRKKEKDKQGLLLRSKVIIDMTLTTPGCPLAQMIGSEVEEKVKKIKGVKDVKINLVFEPPWTPERMSPKLRKQMGFE